MVAQRRGRRAPVPRCRRRAALLEAELRFQAQHRFPDLPRGAVHADLFRDNALFEDGRISGVFDFYFAGVDCFVYDLAVCANDWCLVDPERDRRLDEPNARSALLGAYHAVRPLQPAERDAWPVMLRAAALRFWLSRLHDKHLPRPGELVKVHDPEHFRDDPRAARGARRAGALDRCRMRKDRDVRANRLPAAAGLRWVAEAFVIFRVAPVRQLLLNLAFLLRAHGVDVAAAGRLRGGLAAVSGADGRSARDRARGGAAARRRARNC